MADKRSKYQKKIARIADNWGWAALYLLKGKQTSSHIQFEIQDLDCSILTDERCDRKLAIIKAILNDLGMPKLSCFKKKDLVKRLANKGYRLVLPDEIETNDTHSMGYIWWLDSDSDLIKREFVTKIDNSIFGE